AAERELQDLVDQAQNMVRAVTSDQNISSSNLRRVLRFIGEAVQVFEQVFQGFYTLLVELRYLTDDEIDNPQRLQGLKKEIALTLGSQYYTEAEGFYNRVRQLEKQYRDQIEPITE